MPVQKSERLLFKFDFLPKLRKEESVTRTHSSGRIQVQSTLVVNMTNDRVVRCQLWQQKLVACLEGGFLSHKDYPLNYQRTLLTHPWAQRSTLLFSWRISSQYLWLNCSPRSFQIENIQARREKNITFQISEKKAHFGNSIYYHRRNSRKPACYAGNEMLGIKSKLSACSLLYGPQEEALSNL